MKKKIVGIITCILLCATLPATVEVTANNPLIDPPSGPTEGLVGVDYTFCFDLPDDPECEPYYVMWDWGDGHVTSWIGPYSAGGTVCANHTWIEPGDYDIRVKIRDGCGNEYWSDPWTITIVNITELEIEIQVEFPRKMSAIIRNIGNDTAYDVNYSISVTVKGIVFGLDNMYDNGTVDILPPWIILSWTISTGLFIGFGWFKVTVTASAFNAEEVSRTLNAFVFLFFLRINPGG